MSKYLSIIKASVNVSFRLIFMNKWRLIKPNTENTWSVEICDSNKYSDINMAINQPHQYFKTS